MENENTFKHIESDTAIPTDIDIETAIGSKEFNNFEPAKLEQVSNYALLTITCGFLLGATGM